MYPVSPVTDPNRVIIFDTSLRDGEQAPGFSMGLGEKLRVASVLEALRVDVIEAGFAAASPGDAAAITAVAEQVQRATVCSLARAKDSDIEAAARALETAQRSRVHIFLATSPIHREAKLKMSRAEVLRCAVDAVSLARPLFDEVEFSAEDAIRTEPAFLAEVMRAVAEAGATTLNVPDTVGYSTPPEMTRLFTFLRTALADFK
ncbi:MAG: 2-isopropylmalate synthase, partial [Asticcacaulis sp.]